MARQLGNTKAVCRKCYIHPAVIDACLDGSLGQAMNGGSAEACVKRLLARRRRPRSLVPALKQSLRKLRRRGTQLAVGVSEQLTPFPEGNPMTRNLLLAAMLAAASTSFAQSPQPGQTTPSVTPSQTPAVTPSQTPAVTPSQTPSTSQNPVVAPPSGAPVVGNTAPAPVVEPRSIGGMSRCENALAFEKEKCLQDERAAATGSANRPAATGATSAPGTTSPAPNSTSPAPNSSAPAGTVR